MVSLSVQITFVVFNLFITRSLTASPQIPVMTLIQCVFYTLTSSSFLAPSISMSSVVAFLQSFTGTLLGL